MFKPFRILIDVVTDGGPAEMFCISVRLYPSFPIVGEYPSDIPQSPIKNFTCCKKYFKDNKHKSLNLAKKHPRIFVHRRYLYL